MNSASPIHSCKGTRERNQLRIHGIVQGVGFRPFVYRLARKFSLSGWVVNTAQGALVEIEGSPINVKQFKEEIQTKAPRATTIQNISVRTLPCEGERSFTILSSNTEGQKRSVIPPDLATCSECLKEIQDSQSRRFRYPFTTCTECGPRFSILQAIPYDRSNTTMAKFILCPACRTEYEDMTNRRFHAEAIACPDCGPHLVLWDQAGTIQAQRDHALWSACDVIRSGSVLAVKGLGGFQLWVDASSDDAVNNLRNRKHRPRKPFAVLFSSLESVRFHCDISREEAELLCSSEAPIVLLKKKESSTFAHETAPGNPYIGAMLPYTPLHHLMMKELLFPVIATSGNRSEEPLVIDEWEALIRLKGIADAFLVHDRPIARPVDDSVIRMIGSEPLMLRRARGYAPSPITVQIPSLKGEIIPPVLAVGGHLKNTIAVTTHDHVIMSQHIGDLSTSEAYSQFERTIADQLNLFDVKPQAITCDLHPDYRSTVLAKKFERDWRIPIVPVQHHYAHILACMAEHEIEGPVLGVAWDGAGYGTDGTIWGGEFLLADYSGFKRVGYLQPFGLPGGEVCMPEPRRVALSLLYETFGEEALDLKLPPIHSLGSELASSLMELMKKDVHCSITTSMGRLFDGVSSILGLSQINTFEAEAAMALEFLVDKAILNSSMRGKPNLAFTLEEEKTRRDDQTPDSWIADWHLVIRAIVEARLSGKDPSPIAFAFHQAAAKLITDVVRRIGAPRVILTGGVFQNALLLQLTQSGLREAGLTVYTHHHVPPNDGGLALGQAIFAANIN